MAVSVRMDTALERELEQAAQRAGITKSQFIVDAVEQALGRKDAYGALLKAQRQFGIASSPESQALRQPEVPYGAESLRDKLTARHESDMRDWLDYQAARQRGQAWQPDDATGQGAA